MISDLEGYEGDLTVLKQITGNDIIAGRAKYVQGAFDIKKTGNVMIIANNPFFTKEGGNAVLRRLLVFPSLKIVKDRTYLIEPSDSVFRGPLAEELPGILSWVLGMELKQAHPYLRDPRR
jgi:phage/plasmid-associated DNA primase